jgi:hypothetical protein
MSGHPPPQERELARAREALDRGEVRRASRRAWDAGLAAARVADARVLEAVIDVATAMRDRASGRARTEAEELVVFCTASLANARRSAPPRSMLATLLPRRPEPAPGKICPDCAETVKPAARVCRFCGYRFEPAP